MLRFISVSQSRLDAGKAGQLLELCAFRLLLPRSQGTARTNHCISVRTLGDDQFPCAKPSPYWDSAWWEIKFSSPSSPFINNNKNNNLCHCIRKQDNCPGIKSKRLHPTLLECAMGTWCDALSRKPQDGFKGRKRIQEGSWFGWSSTDGHTFKLFSFIWSLAINTHTHTHTHTHRGRKSCKPQDIEVVWKETMNYFNISDRVGLYQVVAADKTWTCNHKERKLSMECVCWEPLEQVSFLNSCCRQGTTLGAWWLSRFYQDHLFGCHIDHRFIAKTEAGLRLSNLFLQHGVQLKSDELHSLLCYMFRELAHCNNDDGFFFPSWHPKTNPFEVHCFF
jgi:hypothetical protein